MRGDYRVFSTAKLFTPQLSLFGDTLFHVEQRAGLMRIVSLGTKTDPSDPPFDARGLFHVEQKEARRNRRSMDTDCFTWNKNRPIGLAA